MFVEILLRKKIYLTGKLNDIPQATYDGTKIMFLPAMEIVAVPTKV